MGRGRGKFRKQAAIGSNGDPGEEKAMAFKRKGRPQKLLKKESGEEEGTKTIEEEGIDNAAAENVGKRKRSTETEGSPDCIKEENGANKALIIHDDDSYKFAGFRQSGRQRKNKPRRAAEVGVECY